MLNPELEYPKLGYYFSVPARVQIPIGISAHRAIPSKGETSMYDIYHNDRNDEWRYTLGKAGTNPLIAIGLNPSTATQETADTTVAKVEQVAINNGYDGFIMLNLYPVRATDYRSLPATVNPTAFAKNLDAIEAVVSAQSKPVIWAAWGTSVEYHPYFIDARDQLLARLSKYKARWLHFGELTADGHPRHPSRLSYDWKFFPYATTAQSTKNGRHQ